MSPWKIAGASVVLFALSQPVLAQQEGRPVPVRGLDNFGSAGVSWDGRLHLLHLGRYTKRDGSIFVGRWRARVLRPELLKRGAQGEPLLQSVIGYRPFSPPLDFALDPLNGPPESMLLANPSVAPAPGYPENPYRSDAQGRAQATGGFETYRMLVVSHRVSRGLNVRPSQLGWQLVTAVVRAPRTPKAEVAKVWLEPGSTFTPLTSREARGAPLLGIEATVTFDRRLLVWQGHAANDGQIGYLMYSVNREPLFDAKGRFQAEAYTKGWSAPRPISDMFHVHRNVDVAGIPFVERYPLAERALRTAAGRTYAMGEPYMGAYPWVTLDGTELTYTAARVAKPKDKPWPGAIRSALSVIGRGTGWGARHIDGPLNDQRDSGRLRFTFAGLGGVTPGMWTPFRDVPGVPIPYTKGRPVLPLISGNSTEYGEVSFEDRMDGDYLLALRMNELIARQPNGETGFDPTRTPDTSGHFLTAALEGGAAFPQEYEQVDRNLGLGGQAIHFPESGALRVRRTSAPLFSSQEGLTVQLWVRRRVALPPRSANDFRYLLHLPGAWDLIIEEWGEVTASVHAGPSRTRRRSGFVGPALPAGVSDSAWTHVAFTYDGLDLRVYLNGVLRKSSRFGTREAVSAATRDLLVGPAGQTAASPLVKTGTAIFDLDEVFVSRVVRTPAEIAAAAYRKAPQRPVGGTLPVPLPLGLAARDLRVPPGVTTRERVEVGRALFFDPRLSATGKRSCATCHDPQRGLSDGRRSAPSLQGGFLALNTPTIFNRAFSTHQFWDGRAATLEEQSTQPIEHPQEMGLPLDDALRFLKGVPDYVRMFKAAFGGEPTRERMQQALAAFQRTLLSGDSRVDRFEAGRLDALREEERRGRILFQGKARCITCHSGSNYTDEAFHDTGMVRTRTAGRSSVTGRARDFGAFKTPTLRDVALTGPYLHDGSEPTLEGVVELYNRGGLRSAGRSPLVRPLGMTRQERQDLVAFLRALGSSGPKITAPAQLPGPNVAPPPPRVRGLSAQMIGGAPIQPHVAARAVDGDPNTYAQSNRDVPWDLLVDLRRSHRIEQVALQLDAVNSATEYRIGVAQNPGGPWTVVANQTQGTLRGSRRYFPVRAVVGRYVRLEVVRERGGGGGWGHAVRDLGVYGLPNLAHGRPAVMEFGGRELKGWGAGTRATDGDVLSYAQSYDDVPWDLVVDLGGVQLVGEVQVRLNQQNFATQAQVLLAEQRNGPWTRVLGTPSGRFTPRRARYVKLDVLQEKGGGPTWGHAVHELEVYAD